jgi:epoxyqueuosine reductase QueG
VTDLTDVLLGLGASLVGYADLTALPAEQRLGMPRGVSIGVALDPDIVASIMRGPTQEYFGEYNRVNALLDRLAGAGAGHLRQRGHAAVALRATVHRLDPGTLSTSLPHKTVATRAGLGWIGRTALLVTKRYGSAVRLTTVLADAPLEVGQPVDECQCGQCDLCVKACPAGAATGAAWSVGMQREGIVDAFACCAKARELSSRAGITATICGICISVCPWTGRYVDESGA